MSADAGSLVERQVRERRQRILAATRRYVAKHGVEDINVRDLAKGCGISVPTIYRTFGSKDALLSEAIQHFAEKSLRTDALSELSGEGYARLLSLIELWARGSAVSGDDEPAFVRSFLASDAGRKLAFRVTRQIQSEAEQVLREMQTRSELVGWADPSALAARITGQSIVASIECASGFGSASAYRAAFVYACCLLMIGVTEGKAQAAFRDAAERVQPSTVPSAR